MIKFLVKKGEKYAWKRNPDILNDTFNKRVAYDHFEVEYPKDAKTLWGLTKDVKNAYCYSSKKEALRVAAKIDADGIEMVEV